MPFLDAALAFALTMLVVSTAVSYIFRGLQKVFGLRSKELKRLLEDYLENGIQLRVEQLKADGKLPAGVVDGLAEKAKALKLSELFAEKLARGGNVSTEDLLAKLKDCALGKELEAKLTGRSEGVMKELGERFEAFGKESTRLFREKSRWWTTGIALFLAFAVNIDSIHLIESYVQNEGARQAVIAQRDAFVDDYEALVGKLEKDAGKDSVTKEELEQAFKDSRERVDTLASAPFPIGWSYFPHCGLADIQSKEFMHRHNLSGWVTWLIGIALTGWLAGLGAPFWYEQVAAIKRARG